MPGHDYRPVDYDRLYYRLDLEPGANEADIKHRYRHLAQILHPDKWRHPTAASVRWADEQFKRVKEARELLEAYWSVHHGPPVSRAALSLAQAEQLRGQMQSLETQRERVRGELDALRAERMRMLDEIARMRIERDALHGELAQLREEALPEKPRETAPKHTQRAQHTQRAPSHGLRDFMFSRFDDPSRGWLFTLSAIVATMIVVFVIAHGVASVLFAPIARFGIGRALASGFQWLLAVCGVVLALGWGWSQRTFHRAAHAGGEHGVALPVDETMRRIGAALRHESHYGAQWHVQSYEAAPGDAQFAMRAVLRFSARAGRAAPRQSVTFACRAYASGPAQTALAYEFEVSAPSWWLVSAGRVVKDLRRRVDADLGALR
ncbi:J domain-containing protein [Paraburkholderia sp. J41]|uniref:J domain-containing protein n=1 Tax=Paraburkholderia sp. J41 TaxID=2805433 RepID=UPI002AC3367B|nr:DnaJ domain-containing protein [Paraburkholderia sp. J41]